MERLRARGLDEVVVEVARSGRPLLGLCLGMQLLFERSAEGEASCLGLLPGNVQLMRVDLKVPHIGWNQVDTGAELAIWRDLPVDPYFYFVHSYVCVPDDPALSAGATEYGATFCSAVVADRVWGVQFHPERSGDAGLHLIRNFVSTCVTDVTVRRS
jgi:imidazole glycerol-phosphate synthase subunit HisH